MDILTLPSNLVYWILASVTDQLNEEFEKPKPKPFEDIEEEFYNWLRVHVIVLLFCCFVYILSYIQLLKYHQSSERLGGGMFDDYAKTTRICLYICAVPVGVAIGNTLLLPMSMISNEVVHLYPDSYLLEWLNGSLVHSIWECLYSFNCISLIIIIPFIYFYTESVGLTRRRGQLPRVMEASILLVLFLIIICSIILVSIALVQTDYSYFGLVVEYGSSIILYIHSGIICIWLFFTVIIFTPKGLIIIFNKVSSSIVKPNIFGNYEQEINKLRIEETSIRKKLSPLNVLSHQQQISMCDKLREIWFKKSEIEDKLKATYLQRNILCPVVMTIIIFITGAALFLVIIHIWKMIFYGDEELHSNSFKGGYRNDIRNLKKRSICRGEDYESMTSSICHEMTLQSRNRRNALGAYSMSAFGAYGIFIEIVVIIFLSASSIVGLYSLPSLTKLRPKPQQTLLRGILLNTAIILISSSSFSIHSRILGITDFELQGSFGRFNWLGNFKIVFFLNVLFACSIVYFLRTNYLEYQNQLLVTLGSPKCFNDLLPNIINFRSTNTDIVTSYCYDTDRSATREEVDAITDGKIEDRIPTISLSSLISSLPSRTPTKRH